jgi:hypothetical protein
MAEKDPKKVEEKAGTQVDTVQLTPEMTLFLSTLTNTFSTVQKSFGGAPTLTTEPPPPTEFTVNAKIAVERFNFIRAGLQLKLIPYPVLTKAAADGLKINLEWKITDEKLPPSGFQVLRAIGKDNEEFKEITAVLPPSQTKYTDESGITASTTYRYKVVAFTSMGPLPSKPMEVTTNPS